MASNAQPPWPDVAGNLVRRVVIFVFNHQVKCSDPHLFDRLRDEIPIILIKIASMYLRHVTLFGSTSLWGEGILPDMCHMAKRQYLISSNPLSAFLDSDHIIFQQHMQMDASDFRQALCQFMKDNGDRRGSLIGPISMVDHGHLFSMYNCTISERQLSTGSVRSVIHGLCLSETSVM